MNRALSHASLAPGLDVPAHMTSPISSRVPRDVTGAALAESPGARGNVIRIKLGHLAHADVGLPDRRCRWACDAGAWRECSTSPLVRSGIRLPHARPVPLGTLLLALVLTAAWLLSRERVPMRRATDATTGVQVAVQAGPVARADVGVADATGVGKAAGPSPVVAPPRTVPDVDGAVRPPGGAPWGEGRRKVASSAATEPPPVSLTTVPSAPALTAHATPVAAPVPAPLVPGGWPASAPHGLPRLPTSTDVALATAPSRLPALAANASPSSAAGGGLTLPGRVDVVADGRGRPGATSERQDGAWHNGTWDAVRAPDAVPADSGAGPRGAADADATEPSDAPARVRTASVARRAAVDARFGSDADLRPSARAAPARARKSSHPRPTDGRPAAAAAASKRRSAAPPHEEPEGVAPADAPRPASAWQRTGHRERLVAIVDPDTVVVPDSRGVPARFRLGDRLPSGARVVRIDPSNGRAETDRGTLFLE